MAFDLSDYNTVPERMAEAFAKYPEGRFQSEIVELPAAFAGQFVAVKARYYRTPDDPTPGEGLAWELVPGKTPYTKDSELMNAETSAWGRALIAAFAADAKKGVASREEVESRRPEPAPRPRSGGRKTTPGIRTDATGQIVGNLGIPTEPQESHAAAPQTNGNDEQAGSTVNLKRDLLNRLGGDKPRAQMVWRTTLETFGYSPDDEIPAEMLPIIGDALAAPNWNPA